MGDGCVDGHDKVEILHKRGGVGEIVQLGGEIGEIHACRGKLRGIISFLQAEEFDAGNFGQWHENVNRSRAIVRPGTFRSGPDQPNAQLCLIRERDAHRDTRSGGAARYGTVLGIFSSVSPNTRGRL